MKVDDLFYSIVPIECLHGNADVRFLGWGPDRTTPHDSPLLDDHTASLLLWDVQHIVGHLVGVLH